ncbi:hypothetical protein K435DRAFT_880948 [Dendrothele bispora CBS 962.96]|uniref:Uncharacterized protein n=1 Tax=Dendrothele bispora (strain CBS 962.96) TaxID=1314807 RepID=A0A4S8KJV4_DENBC|nr:hypothetical protein K435DRAFT_880948 [Dendrothele bispora CBS 962.96]
MFYEPFRSSKFVKTATGSLAHAANTTIEVAIVTGSSFTDEKRLKPVNDTLDPDMPRTNQRTELLGALEGLDFLLTLWKEESERKRFREKREGIRFDNGSTDRIET